MGMTRYVALVRGINVGGHKKVAMDDLRELLRSLGLTDVVTHLQSGNAIFTGDRDRARQLEQELEGAVRRQLGLDAKVLIRTREELAKIVAANPLTAATREPAKLHVAFLSARPEPDRVTAIDATQFEPDQFRLGDRVLYVWYRNGVGRTKLTNDVIERRLGVTATSRNWNTVTKLLELATGPRP